MGKRNPKRNVLPAGQQMRIIEKLCFALVTDVLNALDMKGTEIIYDGQPHFASVRQIDPDKWRKVLERIRDGHDAVGILADQEDTRVSVADSPASVPS